MSVNSDNSTQIFVQRLRDKFAETDGVDAEPEWLEDPTGITVIEHTGIGELDEETQNKLMAVMDQHKMASEKNKLLDSGISLGYSNKR